VGLGVEVIGGKARASQPEKNVDKSFIKYHAALLDNDRIVYPTASKSRHSYGPSICNWQSHMEKLCLTASSHGY
jgi:hypothetical protein